MRTDTIGYRPGDQLPLLQARGEPSAMLLHREIDRYYTALAAELRTVSLTEDEAMLICDALNGTLTEPATMARHLDADIEDAIRMDGLAEKWKVDGEWLITKLAALSFTASLACIDVVECAWNLCANGDADMRENVRKVGLVRSTPQVEKREQN